MYQLDEKLMADNRAIISIATDIDHIDPSLKPGMQVYNADTKDTYAVSGQQIYNRLIQEDAITKKIQYDLNFAGNITIDKDLIVRGNMTNLETEDLLIKDNIIELNKDETGDGITKFSSGIEINRGTKERARMLYSEVTDRLSTSGFTFDLNEKTLFYIYEDGDIKSLKDFYTSNAVVRENLSVDKNFTLTGNALLKGMLTVNKAVDFKTTLNVLGATTLNGATVINANLMVLNETVLKNTLSVAEATTLSKTLSVTGDTTLFSNLNVKKNTRLTGTLITDGLVQFNNTLSVAGATVLSSSLAVTGDTILKKNLIVEGTSTLKGTVGILGALTTTAITNSGLIKTSTLQTTGSTTIGGNMAVTGISTLTGNVIMKNALSVTGGVDVTGPLSVLSATTLADLTVNKAAVVTGAFTTRATTIFENGFLSKKSATFNDNVDIDKSLNVNGALTVIGKSLFSTANLSQNLDVLGTTSLNVLNVKDASSFVGDINAIKVNTEVLTMKMAHNVIRWQNGNVFHSIYGADAITTNRSYSLYNPAINDYNLVFKTETVANKEKGFVFVNGTTPLFHINQSSIRSKNNIFVQREENWSPLLANADQHKTNHAIGGHDFIAPSSIGAVKNTKGTPDLITDIESNKPAASVAGRLFFAKDTKRIFQDIGNMWQIIGGQDTMPWDSVTNKPTTFKPQVASATVLGGVKIGSNIVVDSDGTIHVPKQAIEYSIHAQEFITTENQKTFKLSKSFLVGKNHVSPFVFGRKIPPSAFKETSDQTIELLQGLPAGTIVEFYVLLIPSDLSFINKIEEFNVATNQTRFVLSQGKYKLGANKIKIFLNGALMPKSSFVESSTNSIDLKQCPGVGNHLLIEYIYDPLV